MNRKISIYTYPRCGSTYLYWLFYSSFNMELVKDHSIENLELEKKNGNPYVITVLRNPLDAISSLITMESFYWREKHQSSFWMNNRPDKTTYQNLDEYIDIKMTERVDSYKYFFDSISDYYDLMLNYEDINIQRKNIVEFVSNETNTKIINRNYVDLIYDNPSSYFLRSSKVSGEYEKIFNKVKDNDLSECIDIYNNLLSKCKKFS